MQDYNLNVFFPVPPAVQNFVVEEYTQDNDCTTFRASWTGLVCKERNADIDTYVIAVNVR